MDINISQSAIFLLTIIMCCYLFSYY